MTHPPTERKLPDAGVRFRAPADLAFPAGQAPLVTSASTGGAAVAISRSSRSELLIDPPWA